MAMNKTQAASILPLKTRREYIRVALMTAIPAVNSLEKQHGNNFRKQSTCLLLTSIIKK